MENLKTTSEHHYKGILGALVVLCILLFLVVQFHYIPEDFIFSPSAPVEKFGENVFTFGKGNFQISIYPGWTSTTTVTTFPYTKNPTSFSLQRDGECVFAYGHYDDARENMTQISFGERIFSQDNEQMDAHVYAPSVNVPEDFQFNMEIRQHVPGEVISYYYPLIYPQEDWFSSSFAIFNPKGGKIGNDCTQEANTMLASLKRVYEPITLDHNSKGVLFFTRDAAMFVGEDEIPKMVMTLPEGFYSNLERNTLYATFGGRLHALDIFNKSFSEVPLKGITSTTTDLATFDVGTDILNDHYFQGDDLYYLVGPNCHEFKTRCDLTLRVQNMKSGLDRLLATHVIDGRFLGYRSEENALYLSYQDGDAGYGWGRVDKYDFKTSSLISVGQYELYADDPVSMSNPLLVFINSFGTTRTYQTGEHVPQVHVENGTLKMY